MKHKMSLYAPFQGLYLRSMTRKVFCRTLRVEASHYEMYS